jgi:hypothetical protein
MDNPGLQNIKKLYENLNYFDQYGGSVILFIIITIVLCLLITYCFVMINIQPIISDWANQRCKPNIIPIAGFITHPIGMSAFDYTAQNFNYCIQNINSSIAGSALQPLTFITNSLKNMMNGITNDIQNIRAMFDKVRNAFLEVSQEIMGRIMNITIPLQQMIIVFKDVISKIQGTMTAGLFTLLGTYFTLKSLMGVIVKAIVNILIVLAILIAVFWAIPFVGWTAAIANTIIFMAISLPMVIILVFMNNILNVNSGVSMPKIKCFDEDTQILMNDGTKTKIIDIKNGDVLFENNTVTATIKLEAKNSIMYKLNDIIVSNSHIVKYNEKWIPVSEHPDAIKYISYEKPYLYCLNTTSKTIVINEFTFTDWDEIYDDDINEIKNNDIASIHNLEDIHTYIDGGFIGTTKIKLNNGKEKPICEIEIDDILERGDNVYGIVKINGVNVKEQAKYNLGKNTVVVGGPNLTICDRNIPVNSTLYLGFNNKQILTENHGELYHLLTDTKTFYVDKTKFYDYNAAIDLFLVKNKGKLLSMKYV